MAFRLDGSEVAVVLGHRLAVSVAHDEEGNKHDENESGDYSWQE